MVKILLKLEKQFYQNYLCMGITAFVLSWPKKNVLENEKLFTRRKLLMHNFICVTRF